MIGNDYAVGADLPAQFNIFTGHNALGNYRQAGRRFDPLEVLPRRRRVRTGATAGWTRRVGMLAASGIIGASCALITITNIAFTLGRPLRIEGDDNRLVTVRLGAVEPTFGH